MAGIMEISEKTLCRLRLFTVQSFHPPVDGWNLSTPFYRSISHVKINNLHYTWSHSLILLLLVLAQSLCLSSLIDYPLLFRRNLNKNGYSISFDFPYFLRKIPVL